MPYTDMRSFLATLIKKEEMVKIDEEVDPELELTEIVSRINQNKGPALWFKQIKGSPYPAAVNFMASERRLALAFEVESLDEIAAEIRDTLEPFLNPAKGLMETLKYIPQLIHMKQYLPRPARRAGCQEIVETNPDLTRLPLLKAWPRDAGRHITMPLVILRDPETQRQNMGIYRMQVLDSNRAIVRIHPHKDGAEILRRYKELGKRMPVAVAIGADPATIFAAFAPLPFGFNEMVFSSFLQKTSLEVTRGKTVNLEVPAQAEFILEGFIDPGEEAREGPAGSYTGYYSREKDFPVFHLTGMTRKKFPIFPISVPVKPPGELSYLIAAAARIFLPLLQFHLPEIVDIAVPAAGAFHNCVIVSIDKQYPGQAQKVMHALWGLGHLLFAKVMIVVDKETNPHHVHEVAWKVLANLDAARDLIFTEGPADTLDHGSRYQGMGGKIGIDATAKRWGEGGAGDWPEVVAMDPAVAEQVTRKWNAYGIESWTLKWH